MTRLAYHKFLIPLGIFIALVALSGLPIAWKHGILAFFGILVIIAGLALWQERSEAKDEEDGDQYDGRSFSESDGEESIDGADGDTVTYFEEETVVIEDDPSGDETFDLSDEDRAR